MPIARVNGVSLYYEIAGRGAPRVLVHGFACGIRSWDPQVRALSRYRRVITYDVRGHGLSDAPPEAAAYSQATSVADLHALLAHLKIGRAVVGGLSMGGNRSEEHTSELQSHHDLVCRLLLEKKKKVTTVTSPILERRKDLSWILP